MKKITALLLAAAMCFTLTAAAGAESADDNYEVQPYYSTVASVTSGLEIDGTTAACKSIVSGFSTVTKIVITQTLYRKADNGIYIGVKDASWTKTFDVRGVTYSNKKTDLSDGTYCVLSEFEVTTSTGITETIKLYSNEESI